MFRCGVGVHVDGRVVVLGVRFSTRSSIRVVFSVVYLAISETTLTHPCVEVLGGFGNVVVHASSNFSNPNAGRRGTWR